MIERIISFSLRNRFLVLLVAAGLFAWGIYSVRVSKIDAIPDLSENQVIVYTEWMGRSPQIIEDQITYPLVTNLQGLPKVKYVRASSMFGMSFVYVIFHDDVDVYWARERVLERRSLHEHSFSGVEWQPADQRALFRGRRKQYSRF
jgi:Cu/Ag efflux pump CusA